MKQNKYDEVKFGSTPESVLDKKLMQIAESKS